MRKTKGRRALTKEEMAIVKAFKAGESASDIARRIGVSRWNAYQALYRAGLKPSENQRHGPPPMPQEQQDRIIAYYQGPRELRDTARHFGMSHGTVRKMLARRGVLRPAGASVRVFTEVELADIATRWRAGESQTAIAARYNSSQITISRVLRQHGVISVEGRDPTRHGAWKGGRTKAGEYVLVRVPNEHRFFQQMAGRDGYCLEHRLVMAEILGRPLRDGETVHHINGVKADNRPENLQLRQGRHGKGVMFCCGDCGSTNIIPNTLSGD